MVELALSIPLLLLCLLSIIYFGRFFFTQQVLNYAAQEAARTAARTPNMGDASVRDAVRGFSTDGRLLGVDDQSNPSPVYRILSSAHMLNQGDGRQGNLPPGASVSVSPWDEGNASSNDIVTVTIKYPFGLTVSSRSGQKAENFGEQVGVWTGPDGGPVNFQNDPSQALEASASCPAEIYQE